MRSFYRDLFRGVEATPPDKQITVQVFDVDDTLTRKPADFNNVGLTKDEYFDAARNFPADPAVVELVQMFHSMGDHIAIATARPFERLQETIHWLSFNDIPFDQVMLSNGGESSGVIKQAMIQKLQKDYKEVETLFDDSPYNIEGAQLQGVPTVHLRNNDEYWEQNPEQVYAYGL